MAKLSGPSKKEMEMFEAEHDMDILRRSEELKKDKKRMKRIKQVAAQKARDLEQFANGEGVQAL